MNRELAEKLMDKLIESHKAIDSAERIAREIDDEKLREKIRMTLAKAASDIYVDAMCGILFFYPDLEPYPSTEENEQ